MNTFAESNVDIVEGLQKSSAAMAAMGSSFDSTLSIFTAGQEIIQDASLMGNALRSISMRVRQYDEETEELSEDLANITGDVIELTKVASNNYQGVSLFTDTSQTEYRQLIDYLGDIADIYDEIEAKPRQELLEKLFGKNRAQAGAAILTNFDAAREAMKTLTDSAGSAEQELKVVTESISYKINEFKETFTGIAQDSLTQDFLKSMIDSGIRLLETFSNASPILQNFLNIISGGVTWVTAFVKQIGLIPTIFAGLSLKNVGELNQNTPVYALSLTECA